MAATNVQAFSGDVEVASNLAVNTNTLFVDSVGGTVGIGSTRIDITDNTLSGAGNGLYIHNPVQGGHLLTLGTQRPWVFEQGLSDASTELCLRALNSGKKFNIQSPDYSNVMTIVATDGGGSVGIGTTNPGASKLYIQDDNADTKVTIRGGGSTVNDSNVTIQLLETPFNFYGGMVQYTGSGAAQGLRFGHYVNSATPSVHMAIDRETGRVGIGTSDPSGLFEVYNGPSHYFRMDPGAGVDTSIDDRTSFGATSFKKQFLWRLNNRNWYWGIINDNSGYLGLGYDGGGGDDPNINTIFGTNNSLYTTNIYLGSTTGSGLGITGATGQYGSVKTIGTKNSYGGYAIGDKWVFMGHSNGDLAGIYDDVNNDWSVRCYPLSKTELFYSGASKLQTTSDGVHVSGTVYADHFHIDDYMYHTGDTDTRIGFPGNDRILMRTGGVDRIDIQQGVTYINQDTRIDNCYMYRYGQGTQTFFKFRLTEDDDNTFFLFRNQQSQLNREIAGYVQAYIQDESDDRLKVNEKYITDGLDVIKRLKPQSYDKYYDLPENLGSNTETWINKHEVGFMAQDIYYEVPELKHIVGVGGGAIPDEHITIGDDPTQDPDYSSWGNVAAGIRYTEIIPYNTAAIQDLSKLRESDIDRITVLESQVSNLVARVQTLESGTP